jgi:predicted Zn-dependent protease
LTLPVAGTTLNILHEKANNPILEFLGTENLKYRIYLFVASLAIFFMAGSTLVPSSAGAKGISMIRDAEIENTIRGYATPLLLAAGLEPSSLRIHIVNDNTLNAFVAGGQQIFINTGLIIKSRNASQIIGVLAHEIGHISGGHLIKAAQARKGISTSAIIGMLLGGAAILAGSPEAGSAAIQLGSNIGIKNYLSFSRTQESSADQAALRYLDQTQQSATGFLEFMEVLEDQELLSARNQDPYVRTHPLSRDRIESIRHHLKSSQFADKPDTPADRVSHARIKAKLIGFTQSLSQTLRAYPENRETLDGTYARSIAYYRRPDVPKAIDLIDKLIAQMPKDPYFHELKGQIYFENGKIDLALPSYQMSVDLLPESALLKAQLAQAQIEKNQPTLLKKAVNNLLFSVDKDPTRSFVWRQLGIAYGRLGKMGESSRALAEEAILQGRNSEAIRIAERAKKQLKIGTPNWLRAEDIITAARLKIKTKESQ